MPATNTKMKKRKRDYIYCMWFSFSHRVFHRADLMVQIDVDWSEKVPHRITDRSPHTVRKSINTTVFVSPHKIDSTIGLAPFPFHRTWGTQHKYNRCTFAAILRIERWWTRIREICARAPRRLFNASINILNVFDFIWPIHVESRHSHWLESVACEYSIRAIPSNVDNLNGHRIENTNHHLFSHPNKQFRL